jgi:hypothetical protein
MKKIIAIFLGLVLAVSFASPAKTAEPNVSFSLTSFSGLVVDDGFSAVTEQFSNTSVKFANGLASFSLPLGSQTFVVRTVADSTAGNSTIYSFAVQAEVTADTQIRVTLPRVLSIKMQLEGGSPVLGSQPMWLDNYDVRSTTPQYSQLSGGGNLPPSKVQVSKNGGNSQVLIYGGNLKLLPRDGNGALRETWFGKARGVEVKNNEITFSMFDPVPQSEMDSSYQIPHVAAQFDFDSDGYSDYTLIYPYGVNSAKSVRISRSDLIGNRASINIEGRVGFELDAVPVAGVISKSGERSFRVSGRLVETGSGHLSVNSPVVAYVLGEQQLFDGEPVARYVRVGQGEVSADGKFSLEIKINSNQELLNSEFFLQSALGYSTNGIPIPRGTSVAQKTLASFSSTSTTLTNLQRSQVKAAVEANPNATKFICTGIRYVSQPMSENIKVRKRAKAACDYAKTLNPELSTWYQNKPTEARSYAGKVLLTIKSPAN